MKILLTFSIFHFIWFIENLCFILILKEKMTIFHNKVCVFIMILTAYLRLIFNEEEMSVRKGLTEYLEMPKSRALPSFFSFRIQLFINIILIKRLIVPTRNSFRISFRDSFSKNGCYNFMKIRHYSFKGTSFHGKWFLTGLN